MIDEISKLVSATAQLVSSCAWPIVAIVAIMVFKKPAIAALGQLPLRDLINRMKEAAFGSNKITFDTTSPEAKPPSDEELKWSKVLADKADKYKPGNTFWLGNDLMHLYAGVLLSGSREFIIWQLAHANHHLKEVGLTDSPEQQRLQSLLNQAKHTQGADWTVEMRAEFAGEIKTIANAIGRIIEAQQPNFVGGPEQT